MSKQKLVISEGLIAHMNNCPDKKKVWLNDAGEWSNHKDEKYPHGVSRAEIFSGKTVVRDGDKTEDGEGNTGTGESANNTETGKNTTDAKIKVKITAENKKDAPPGSRVGQYMEVDNPDYEDPALK